MSINKLKQQSLSQFVGETYTSAWKRHPHRYCQAMLSSLQSILGVDALTWTLIHDRSKQVAAISCSGISESFVSEMPADDEATVLLRLDSSHDVSAQLIDPFSGQSAQSFYNSSLYLRHFTPYGVERTIRYLWKHKSIAITSSIALLSGQRKAFSAETLDIFERLGPHLMRGFEFNLMLAIDSSERATAVIGKSGEVFCQNTAFQNIANTYFSGKAYDGEVFSVDKAQTISREAMLPNAIHVEREGQITVVSIDDSYQLAQLSPKEKELTLLLKEGISLKEAAERMELAPGTVASHANRIYKKLGVNGKRGLVRALTKEL